MLPQLQAYVSQFVTLSELEWAAITPLFQPVRVAKDEFLVRHGEVCRQLYFGSRGLLRHYYLHEGRDTTRYFAPENQFATALSSFLTGQPSIEQVQALEETALLRIGYDQWQHLMRTVPAWRELPGRLLEAAYVADTRRLESFICQTGQQRYEALLRHQANLVQRVPQYHLATYLGLQPETLSRIRRKVTPGPAADAS